MQLGCWREAEGRNKSRRLRLPCAGWRPRGSGVGRWLVGRAVKHSTPWRQRELVSNAPVCSLSFSYCHILAARDRFVPPVTSCRLLPCLIIAPNTPLVSLLEHCPLWLQTRISVLTGISFFCQAVPAPHRPSQSALQSAEMRLGRVLVVCALLALASAKSGWR